ncbi:unnamed protein product [Hyaloperonospora brassicae]|uniref:SSD domain-containing protein n=1 Tax=Hyaloperonospora brassicae TaxID=162125 RepID=A0AAV0TLK1_HYABA|nr:unnamed protein product [Hyaloperonospora brassicae]
MRVFFRLGALCGASPVPTALYALLGSIFLCLGLLNMQLQTDPQGLWVPPNSVAAQEQARVDALFGPFFRIEQLIFYVDDSISDSAAEVDPEAATCDSAADLVQRRVLQQMATLQTQIAQTVVHSADNANVSLQLEDFCYRPIRGKGCLVTSPFQYWLSNATLLENDPDIKLTAACQTTDPELQSHAPCMDENGVPVMRNVVFGGLSRDDCHTNPDPCGEATPAAKALIVTFLLNSKPENETYTRYVELWEKEVFLKTAEQAAHSLMPSRGIDSDEYIWDSVEDKQLADAGVDGVRLTYMAERSVADSLVVQTKQNAFIVVVSYLVMFLYVSASLGKFQDPVRSRFGLGFTGILIVLLSLGAAMGVSCAILQMKVTMITLEVVPFLVLAIGVDNMFILANEFDRLAARRGLVALDESRNMRDQAEDESLLLKQVTGETMQNVGPSIAVAAVTEALAFSVGVLTRIPALTSFCVVAGLAVVANFLLQMTWFASALVLDARRVRARRYDVFPWIQQTPITTPLSEESKRNESKVHRQYELLVEDSVSAEEVSTRPGSAGVIQRFVEKTYTPFLLQRSTKILVLVTGFSIVTLSAFGSSELHLGLQQELAVPTDFYLHEYFKRQTALGEAGPPAYVVLDGAIDYTDGQQQTDLNVLLDELSGLRQYIELPIYSWLHTFNQWRQMRFFLQDKINQGLCDCPIQPMDPFPYEVTHVADSDVSLAPALGYNALAPAANVTPNALFYSLVKNFTKISIGSSCCQQFGLCGAQYEGDIVFDESSVDEDSHANHLSIIGSRMRFQLNAMRNQSMFVNSYYYLHDVTSAWSSGRVATAFPYALIFVFEEQYTYIQGVALQSVLLALAVVFAAVFVLMDGSLRLAAVVTFCVLSMAFSQLGFLFVWNLLAGPSAETSINAISVVNLLACIGLGVEFCVHMAHQFSLSRRRHVGGTSDDHTRYALTSVGASIFSGITLTKFCGIGVLAFAPSMLFRVYFFRMYLGIVVLGCFHGLALLPVLLSLLGQPQKYPNDLGSFLLSEERSDEFEDEPDVLE